MKTEGPIRREKRTAPVTVHMPPSLRQALAQLSAHEQRTLSTYVCRIVEQHPVVRVVLQQIGGPLGN